MLWSGDIGCFWLYANRVVRNPALGIRGINVRITRVHKYHHARISLLVNEEHSLAKPVR
jgi:hypothetical protein